MEMSIYIDFVISLRPSQCEYRFMISLRTRSIVCGLLFCILCLGEPLFAAGSAQSIQVIAHGQQVDIKQHLVRGKITIIDFYANWCGPCRQITPLLEQLAKSDPGIVLRKIDIINWQSPVAKQFNLDAIPHVQIYNRKGKLVGAVTGVDPEQVQNYVARAKL